MLAALAHDLVTPLAAKGSFLIKPGIGLMVWTLLVFGITMALLAKYAFPPISAAEAEKILAEYRQRLQEARAQADEIIQRARQTAEAQEREAKDRGQEIVAEASQRAQREIEAATKRALEELRNEVADLTITATEKVTRKALDPEDQKRLVEEALRELDFSGLSSGASNN